jgi:hypothetical protein
VRQPGWGAWSDDEVDDGHVEMPSYMRMAMSSEVGSL